MRTSTTIEIAVTTVILLMAVGTITFHYLEGWNLVDSFYFTGVTLSTIGYGDLYPTTDISKIFTVIFAFSGVGVFAFALSVIASSYFERREKMVGQTLQKRFMELMKKQRVRK